MRKLALLAVLLWSGSAAAHEIQCPTGGVDGQRVARTTTNTGEVDGKIPSPSFNQTAYWLCCNQAAGACDDKDVGGAYSAYIFSLEDVNTCTAVDVSVGFRNDASGVFHTVGTLSLGTTSIVVPRVGNRRIAATVNTATGCTVEDEVDVRIDLLDDRSESQ